MTKIFTVMGMSAFLVFSGVSVFAEQSQGSSQGDHSNDAAMQGTKNMGSSIESKSPTNAGIEPEPTEAEQKRARPGGVGEEGSLFGSPSTFPPGDTSQGYTGEDKKAEKMEQRKQGM
ncbi:MAG: hypothetical protein ABI618_16870 [Nitrospirota bacterium]